MSIPPIIIPNDTDHTPNMYSLLLPIKECLLGVRSVLDKNYLIFVIILDFLLSASRILLLAFYLPVAVYYGWMSRQNIVVVSSQLSPPFLYNLLYIYIYIQAGIIEEMIDDTLAMNEEDGVEEEAEEEVEKVLMELTQGILGKASAATSSLEPVVKDKIEGRRDCCCW